VLGGIVGAAVGAGVGQARSHETGQVSNTEGA
jgi:hypothetical protein